MERLGLGPDELLELNPRLVYARLTGWGQHGDYATTAGHDINYIAISGALSMLARPGERPLPPVNLLGDFGGGTLPCALGIALALFERESSGRGQMVDAAMVDGAAFLTSFLHRLVGLGLWDPKAPGTNLLDSGAPFYDTFRCADGQFVAVGAIEPQFYAELLRVLRLEAEACMKDQLDQKTWPSMRAKLEEAFLSKPRDEWARAFAGTDACVSPVLSLEEAAKDAHNAKRGLFVHLEGETAPWVSPPPVLSRSPALSVEALKHEQARARQSQSADQLVRRWNQHRGAKKIAMRQVKTQEVDDDDVWKALYGSRNKN